MIPCVEQQYAGLPQKRGYAVDRGEHEVGLYCVGAPILNARGRVIGSCSVSGSDPETIRGRLPEFSARVMHTAQEISRRMGFVPARLSSVVADPTMDRTTQVAS
jgi:DNA-binding IclR family transcriptional regulator